jgi:RHS repeat-associated protein
LDLAAQNGGPTSGRSALESAGGIGGLLAMYGTNRTPSNPNDDQQYWYLYDGNGNVGQVVSASNLSIAETYDYDPYGKRIEASSATATAFLQPFRFSTKYWDDETGLGNWGYRYYSPTLGRWISRDPMEEGDGAALYALVRNMPVVAADALGQGLILPGYNVMQPDPCGPRREFETHEEHSTYIGRRLEEAYREVAREHARQTAQYIVNNSGHCCSEMLRAIGHAAAGFVWGVGESVVPDVLTGNVSSIASPSYVCQAARSCGHATVAVVGAVSTYVGLFGEGAGVAAAPATAGTSLVVSGAGVLISGIGVYASAGAAAAQLNNPSPRDGHFFETQGEDGGRSDEATGGAYVLRDPETGEVVRSGRTKDLASRQMQHARDPVFEQYQFDPLYPTDSYAEQRGLEQMLHDRCQPCCDKINGISPRNPLREEFMRAAREYLRERGECH